MLLYKLDQFKCDVILPPLSVEGADLLDGHIRTFCLWRKKVSYILPLLVTVAYVPPARPVDRAFRKIALSVIPQIVKWVSDLRRRSQHVIVTHVNAADGCVDLKTNLAAVLSSKCVEELPSVGVGYDSLGRGM